MFRNMFKSAKKIQNQNVLEALVAAVTLVAAADGDISKKEQDKIERLLLANDNLSAYKPADVRKLISKYSGLLETDFHVGKVKMMREIADISDNAEQSEDVFVNAYAVASADGEIDEKETKVLSEIARSLGINATEYGLAA